ncbi:MAG: type III polyketide synthase [Myxococcales bacterium]|nr:type III polyketide synthase [Myxococcales bacterium]
MSARILSASQALPPNYVDQDTLLAAFRAQWGKKHFNLDRLEQLHRAVQVGGRHLALPLREYEQLESFAARNAAWTRVATEVGEEAVRKALLAADVAPSQVDHLYFVTVTGIATPSIDARLVDRVGLRPDVKRVPIFGLGCVAGAAGISRAADVLRGAASEVAVLLAVELCSLTLQREDLSIPNIIASGLFGDGAAAVVVDGGARRKGPRIVANRSVFYSGTERVMGWDVVDSGFKVVLSPSVPQLVRERLRSDVDGFLASQGLTRASVEHFICHSGGPKVLEAFEEALEVPREKLQRSWDSLRNAGNLSSASVLFVLGDLLASGEAKPGDKGLLLAMGPGFCSELVLLEWT